MEEFRLHVERRAQQSDAVVNARIETCASARATCRIASTAATRKRMTYALASRATATVTDSNQQLRMQRLAEDEWILSGADIRHAPQQFAMA